MSEQDQTHKHPKHNKLRGRRVYMALAGLGAAALVGGTMVSTASAHGHRGFGKGRGMMKILRHADLTEEQRSKIKSIHQKYRPLLKAERAESKGTRKRFHSLLTAENVDPAKAEVLRKEFVDRVEQRSAIKRDLMLEVANVLTPAQRRKLAKAMKERHERRAERRQRRRSRHAD